MRSPHRLRVEHLEPQDSLGLTVHAPRMSWQLPVTSSRQVAYRIETDLWDSGRVESSRSLLVPYRGPRLRSRERVSWAVKVWTDLGASDWSDPAEWEMGLLDRRDWVADWIEPSEPDHLRERSPRPAWWFRRRIELPENAFSTARLYVTAHGIYEFFINGERVGCLELTPGFTSYRSRLQVQTFDVGGHLDSGSNLLEALVSDGWFRGQNAGYRLPNVYGNRLALLAQLEVTTQSGQVDRWGTDRGWMTAKSHVTADLFEGQTSDLTRFRHDRDGQSSSRLAGHPARVVRHHFDRLVGPVSPPVRRVEEIVPVSITRLDSTRQIVDLGQNVNGWLRLGKLGARGGVIRIAHGELLDGDGDVSVANVVSSELDPVMAVLPWDFSRGVSSPFEVDQVVSAGVEADVFEPRHTIHGFRYARIEGLAQDLSPADVTGVVVHSDLRRTGWFWCDDDRVNRLHEAAVWSFRGNACEIPTDCPTRERLGWTGDWQVFAPTAAFLYGVAGFADKWLRDLSAEQEPNGVVQHCVPDPSPRSFFEAIGMVPSCAGWGDAAVAVPWEMYRSYGDVGFLDRQWASMTRWVDYAARQAAGFRHPDRVKRNPSPVPHEQFLWDTGFHWGEWLEPGNEFGSEEHGDGIAAFTRALTAADHADVAAAYLFRSARQVADAARVLGRTTDAEHYGRLADSVGAAWQAEFIGSDGTLRPDTQANHVRALAFGLVPRHLVGAAAARLAQLVRAAGCHVGTGFLATPYLLPVLADHGYADLAYDVLLQDTPPSWLAMIDRGATTIWEQWEPDLSHITPATGSLNHYSKGAVVSFLHRYTAGIRLADDVPAYRRFRVAPVPGGGIRHAKAVLDSPYGRVVSDWTITDDRFVLTIVVPPGTTADVELPDGTRSRHGPGTTRLVCGIASTLASAT